VSATVNVSVKANQGNVVVGILPLESNTGIFQALVQASFVEAVHKLLIESSTYFLVAGLPLYSGV
jgi:hypothetical protein